MSHSRDTNEEVVAGEATAEASSPAADPAGETPDARALEAEALESIEQSMRCEPRVVRPANRLLILASVAVLAVSGAGAAWELYRGQPEIPPPPVPASAQLTEQIAAIRDKTAPGDTFGGGRIEIEDQPLSDADLEALRGLEGVRTLILDGGAISDAGLEVIATLPDLQHLRVRHSQITDAGVAALSACERLRVLNLPQANLTPDGVLTLRQVDSLRQLRLGGDGKVDLSRSVAQLHQLRAVHLINVPVSDEGLRALASLPRLESLYLDQPKVSEAGWDWLFHHHPHLHVHLNQTHHDRDPNWHAHGGDASESESAAMPR